MSDSRKQPNPHHQYLHSQPQALKTYRSIPRVHWNLLHSHCFSTTRDTQPLMLRAHAIPDTVCELWLILPKLPQNSFYFRAHPIDNSLSALQAAHNEQCFPGLFTGLTLPQACHAGGQEENEGLGHWNHKSTCLPLALKSQSRAARAASLLWTSPPRGEAHSVTGSFLHLHPKLGTAAALQELSALQGQQES